MEESESSFQTFVIRDLGSYNEVKISAFALYDNLLLVGDDKGNLVGFPFNQNEQIGQSNKINLTKYGKKVEKIVVSYPKAVAFVLINLHVLVFSLPNLNNICQLEKHTSVGIALDACDKVECARLLTISKKRKVRQYQFDKLKSTLTLIEKKELVLDENPEVYEWYDTYLCYKHKNKIHWVDINSGKKKSGEFPNTKHLVYVNDGLLASSTGNGIFLKEGGIPIQINPLTYQSKFIEVGKFKSYLVALHEDSMLFFAKEDNNYKCIQKIDVTEGEIGKTIAFTNNSIALLSTDNKKNNSFYLIEELPYVLIIGSLLNKGKYNDALAKLNDNIPSTDPNKPKLIEHFFLNCSWMCIINKDFKLAYEYGHISNFNPFEYIYPFYTLIPMTILHKDCVESITSQLAINQINQIIIGDKDDKEDKEEKDRFISEAYDFLQKILQYKRRYIISRYEFPRDSNEVMTFDSSDYSLINLSSSNTKIKLGELLSMINITLVKVMVKSKRPPKELASIIDTPFFTCTGICDFLKDDFFKNTQTSERDVAMAYFYEKKGDYGNALKIWKDFGVAQNVEKKIREEAIARTKGIFIKFQGETLGKEKNSNLYKTYSEWLLDNYPEESFDVQIITSIVDHDFYISSILFNLEKKKPESNLRERFLTLLNERDPTTKYQTKLLELYIDILLSENLNEDKKTKYYKLFMDIIQADKICYNESFLLDKIKGTWLIDAEVYLYSKCHLHSVALDKLLEGIETGRNNFYMIEDYCEENIADKPDILTEYFQKLLKKKNELVEDNKDEKLDQYTEEMLNLLEKYGDITQLDPIYTLENLPPNINACDGILHEYINKVIKEYTSLNNKYTLTKSLSDMALMYKEKEVLDAKEKYVSIESDTICELCKKKIGNTIFYVYPNMMIFHSKCAQNISICPTTGVDFTKKKMI